MSDSPQTEQERPLVTFALFAYNQEDYIREAIEGAFSQTYEPLEIILSDDCSSDRTFAIMQEMAAAYDGPHRVRVRQSDVNAGFAKHINDVARLVEGSIVILAAGDDVSSPNRASVHANVYKNYPKTFAVCSDYRTFPNPNAEKRYPSEDRVFTMAEIIYNGGGVQIGATYSYRRECLTWPAELPLWLISEDRLLPFRAALMGQVKCIPSILMAYRISDELTEIKMRSVRIRSLNNPKHFPHLSYEVEQARCARKIGLLKSILLKLFINARSRHVYLLNKNLRHDRMLNLVFMPLRIVRKISIALSHNRENVRRSIVGE